MSGLGVSASTKTQSEYLAKVEKDVKMAIAAYPNKTHLANPLYAGWIDWAAFHLDDPCQTMRMLRAPDVYPTVQYIFTRFAVYALLARQGVKYNRFEYLITFTVILSPDRKSKTVSFDKEKLHDSKYKVSTAYVIQVTIVTSEGLSKTSTIWLENNIMEVFDPWEHKSELMGNVIAEHVVPFLKRKWIANDMEAKVVHYKIRPDMESMNWWNLYFLFLRSTKNNPIPEMFSDMVVLSSLVEARNRVVQTCGRIISVCSGTRDPTPGKQKFTTMFGPDAMPFPLEREAVEFDLPNFFARCSIPKNKLWNSFNNIEPDMIIESSAPGDVEWLEDTLSIWNPYKEERKKKMVFISP
jgi:hypothetical protein